MMFEVRISKHADIDLRGIYEYIAFHLCSPLNASRQLERLESAISKLNYLPERFRLYGKDPWYSYGLRIMPLGNFLVFYFTDMEKQIVTVSRVIYGGRDIDSAIEGLV